MKKLLFPLFMLAMIVTSCEKDPDMNNWIVTTAFTLIMTTVYISMSFPPITCQIAFWFRTTA